VCVCQSVRVCVTALFHIELLINTAVGGRIVMQNGKALQNDRVN